MFCKHKWSILSETITKSTFDLAMETLKGAGHTSDFTLPGQLCKGERRHIQVITCDKCGRLKRFVEVLV
jgi:hypothetical protein